MIQFVKNSTPGKVANICQIERVQMDAIVAVVVVA